jgi:hypothetical protein
MVSQLSIAVSIAGTSSSLWAAESVGEQTVAQGIRLSRAAAPQVVTKGRPWELRISEFFINSPRSIEEDEYVEVLGPPGEKLDRAQTLGEFSYFIIVLANDVERAGQVLSAVSLSGVSFNEMGYASFHVAEGEGRRIENGYRYDGTFDTSGGTLMLVAVPFGHPSPKIAHNYDASQKDIAMLGRDWNPNWMLVDSIGVVCKHENVVHATTLFSPVNFVAGDFSSIAIPDGAIAINTTIYDADLDRGAFFEINYVGRRSYDVWFAAQLTDRSAGWNDNKRNYAVSADEEHYGEGRCVDQHGRAPFDAFEEITVGLGSLAPMCPCDGRRAEPPIERSGKETEEPTLAESSTVNRAQKAPGHYDLRETTSLVVPSSK